MIKLSKRYYKPAVLLRKLKRGGILREKYFKLLVRKARYKYWRQIDSVRYWNFFDYFKVNKFYTYKYKKGIYKGIYNGAGDNPINLLFIKRFRKDYINTRNYLIRFMSAYFYYESFKRVGSLYKLKLPKLSIKTINFRLK